MKMFIKFLVVLVAISSLGASYDAFAKSFTCPPYYECALISDVVSGEANCPDGYKCVPVAPGMVDCPPLDVCFYKVPWPKSDASAPAEPAASTGPFISSVDPFPLHPGSVMTIYGDNLGASSTLIITNGSFMSNIIQDSVKKGSGTAYTITATLPSFIAPGSYMLYFDFGGTKSNSASLFVTAGSPTGQSTTNTDGTTNTNTTPNATNNTNITVVNTPIQTYLPVVPPTRNTDDETDYTRTTPNVADTTTRGARIRTTDNLRVRLAPSASGAIITTQPLGATGVIKEGPVNADGYAWWNIDYTSGGDGWSAGNYLISDITDGGSSCFTFANNLSFGSGHADVFYLQTALAAEGFSITSSEKTPSPYFGPSTLAAVKGFQVKYSIYPQAGYVGPLTRTRLNAIYGCR